MEWHIGALSIAKIQAIGGFIDVRRRGRPQSRDRLHGRANAYALELILDVEQLMLLWGRPRSETRAVRHVARARGIDEQRVRDVLKNNPVVRNIVRCHIKHLHSQRGRA